MAEPVAVKRKSTRTSYATRKKLKLVPSSFELFDLNDDCLIHIFKCMDIVGLAKLCRTCKRFQNLIINHIIPFRTIDFSAFSRASSVRNMFALFGKSMTRIVVHQDDIQTVFPGYTRFAEFLRMLVEYGQPGKLKQVNLTFGGYCCHVPGKLLQDAGPYFANVQKLEYNFTTEPLHMDTNHFTNFFEAIHKQNLRELCVDNVTFIGDWLSAESLMNVRKLHLCLNRPHHRFHFHLHHLDATNESRLIHFFSQKPVSLIDFECIDAPSDAIFVELSRRLSNTIERVGEIKYRPNVGTVNNNNNNNGGGALLNGFSARWRYFNGFTNLKDVSLKSSTVNFSDSGEAFSIMAKRQTIEHLRLTFGWINSDQGNAVKTNDLKCLTRLKSLHLINFDDKRCKGFVNELFANLPALTSCTIEGKHPTQGRIIELIKSARHLKVLKLCGKFKSFSVPFYKSLVKCRARTDGQEASEENRLVIHIDGDIAQKCLDKLGKRYKPSIVMVRLI